MRQPIVSTPFSQRAGNAGKDDLGDEFGYCSGAAATARLLCTVEHIFENGPDRLPLTITPLTPVFAARVTGVDISRPLGESVFAEIRTAFDAFSVLVFPDAPRD